MSAKPIKKPTSLSNTPSRGRADLARLRRMTEKEIRDTSPPELANIPDAVWERATITYPVAKRAISLRVDEDVLAFFKAQGPRYQTRINAVLRSYMRAAPAGPASKSAAKQRPRAK